MNLIKQEIMSNTRTVCGTIKIGVEKEKKILWWNNEV